MTFEVTDYLLTWCRHVILGTQGVVFLHVNTNIYRPNAHRKSESIVREKTKETHKENFMEASEMTEGKENATQCSPKQKRLIDKIDQSCQFDGIASGTTFLVIHKLFVVVLCR